MRIIQNIKTDFFKLRKSPELKKSIVYAISSVIAYGIVFVQNFSVAYFVSIDFFGKISLIISLFSTLYIFFTFGLNAVILRFNFEERFKSDRQKLVSHIVSIWIPLGAIASLFLLAIGYKVIFLDQNLPMDYWSEFVPILLAALLFSSVEIFPQIFVAEENPMAYALFLVASRFLIFVTLHIIILVYGEYAFGVSLALLLSGLTICIVCCWVFKFFLIVRVETQNLREILLYASPLLIYSLGGIGYSHGYRVLISNQLSLQNLAVFSMASQIASAYYLAAASCVTGLYPKAYLRLEENNGAPSSIQFYLRALLYIGLGFLIVIFPIAYFFLLYFKSGLFMPAFKILPILLIGQFVFFLYGYNYVLCTFFKKTKILTYSMGIGVITSLGLAYFILETNTLWSAALPIVCGFFVQFIISLVTIRIHAKNQT